MTREKLAKELEKLHSQIENLKKKEKELSMQKDAADLAASIALVEKKKIAPELLQAICNMKEDEIQLMLEIGRKDNHVEENRTEKPDKTKSN